MHTSPTVRKVFEGVATRHDMHRMFNRHRGDPAMAEGEARHLFAGEWFELAESEHDYMLEILPPLWIRADMFAMREFMTGNVTSIFLALWIDRRKRFFHGYCDLSDRGSPERMKHAIVERESRPIRAMTPPSASSTSGRAPMTTFAATPARAGPPLCKASARCWSSAAGWARC